MYISRNALAPNTTGDGLRVTTPKELNKSLAHAAGSPSRRSSPLRTDSPLRRPLTLPSNTVSNQRGRVFSAWEIAEAVPAKAVTTTTVKFPPATLHLRGPASMSETVPSQVLVHAPTPVPEGGSLPQPLTGFNSSVLPASISMATGTMPTADRSVNGVVSARALGATAFSHSRVCVRSPATMAPQHSSSPDSDFPPTSAVTRQCLSTPVPPPSSTILSGRQALMASTPLLRPLLQATCAASGAEATLCLEFQQRADSLEKALQQLADHAESVECLRSDQVARYRSQVDRLQRDKRQSAQKLEKEYQGQLDFYRTQIKQMRQEKLLKDEHEANLERACMQQAAFYRAEVDRLQQERTCKDISVVGYQAQIDRLQQDKKEYADELERAVQEQLVYRMQLQELQRQVEQMRNRTDARDKSQGSPCPLHLAGPLSTEPHPSETRPSGLVQSLQAGQPWRLLTQTGTCLGTASSIGGSDAPTLDPVHGHPPEEESTVASVAAELRDILQTNPYLETTESGADPHHLQYWVRRCHEAVVDSRVDEAKAALDRISAGLSFDNDKVAAAFRHFDIDGSGTISAEEFHNMSAYLFWGGLREDAHDLNKDGVISLEEFQHFVASMGGLQRLFRRRRRRVASGLQKATATDVIAGSRVRSHFWINGQKSRSWREAQVLDASVQMDSSRARRGMHTSIPQNPAEWGTTQNSKTRPCGALLSFGFTPDVKGKRWRARQVVPLHWIVSTSEDAETIAALKEVGILEDSQSFWKEVFPETELSAVKKLVGCQRAALRTVREHATANHNGAYPGMLERFNGLGFGERELQAVLGWVSDLAPAIVHVDIDQCGAFLEVDEYYRNQFETHSSGGALDEHNETRIRWERDLFGGAYDGCEPFERPKYGALNVTNDYRGVTSAHQYGDSYMVLKDVRLRLTFAATDSAGMEGSRLAVLDKYAHVLKEYEDEELTTVVSVAMAAVNFSCAEPPQLLRGSTEDSTSDWITKGFPRLGQACGQFYFEVELFEGCASPQVGLVTEAFKQLPNVTSTSGVGDDEHSWAVDGTHSARWHGGRTKVWTQSWPEKNNCLSKKIVVGVAVDIVARRIWFSTDGMWDKEPTFDTIDVKDGAMLYPAVSLQGRAAFIFCDFQNSPPSVGGRFSGWPGAPKGPARVDCPLIGNSDSLGIYKEVQIHGEVNLKLHVQRLVANRKYRDKPKPQRSWAVRVSNAGKCDGIFNRAGAHNDMPFYRSVDAAIIYWDKRRKRWHINDMEDFTLWIASALPAAGDLDCELPRQGWELLLEAQGVASADLFRRALVAFGVASADVESLMSALSLPDARQQICVFRVTQNTSFEAEWKKLGPLVPGTADEAWQRVVIEARYDVLKELGILNAEVVSTLHPYEAKAHSESSTVKLKGVKGLVVKYSSKCCTLDRYSMHTVRASIPSSSKKSAGLDAPQGVDRFERYGSTGWDDVEIPGDSADFTFETDGDGASCPNKRWGVFALVVPSGSDSVTKEVVDRIAQKWDDVSRRIHGCSGGAISVKPDDWDEARLRGLCARHGWDFEWIAEDGERKRRANETIGERNAERSPQRAPMEGDDGTPDGYVAV